jgi:transcription initiation factor IIE alpha subunit
VSDVSTDVAPTFSPEEGRRWACEQLGHVLLIFEAAGVEEFECERCGEIWRRDE